MSLPNGVGVGGDGNTTSLIGNTSNGSGSGSGSGTGIGIGSGEMLGVPQQKASPAQRWFGLLSMVSILGGFFFLQESKEKVAFEKGRSERMKDSKCSAVCEEMERRYRRRFGGGDLLNARDVVSMIETARASMISTLQDEETHYGPEIFKNMFEEADGSSRGRTAFLPANDDGPSAERLRRKMKIKLLEVQMNRLAELEGDVGDGGGDEGEKCRCRRRGDAEAEAGYPYPSKGRSDEGNPSSSSLPPHSSNQDRTRRERRRRHLQQDGASAETDASTSNDGDWSPSDPDWYAQFVWATGGHSAAAGHGNFFNQSYTAFMELFAAPVFEAVGIDFEGRNYAMGGMSSGPEIALCQEALFGIDADVISWDFGMTDGRASSKQLLYSSRAGVHLNRPAVVALNIEGRSFKGRRQESQTAEDMGLASFYLHPDKVKQMYDAVPDMEGYINMPEQALRIPPMVRDFKCNQKMESGEPTCGTHKYNTQVCPKRKHMASWHPGWRVMAVYGTTMALFLTDYLLDAARELRDSAGGTNEHAHPAILHAVLRAEEDKDYEVFAASGASSLPATMFGLLPEEMPEPQLRRIIEALHRNPAVCRTSLLPAHSRYLGMLNPEPKPEEGTAAETPTLPRKRGSRMHLQLTRTNEFYQGMTQSEADRKPEGFDVNNRDQGMEAKLVYEAGDREPCPVQLKMDHKDFFYVSSNYGWTGLSFPNDAEKAEYVSPRGSTFRPEGILIMCFVTCDWGKCPQGDVRQEAFHEGHMRIDVNGVAVHNMTSMSGCQLLSNERGLAFHPDERDRYEIKVLVDATIKPKANFARITSLILL